MIIALIMHGSNCCSTAEVLKKPELLQFRFYFHFWIWCIQLDKANGLLKTSQAFIPIDFPLNLPIICLEYNDQKPGVSNSFSFWATSRS